MLKETSVTQNVDAADITLKELHDDLLSRKPEGASHPADCPLCQSSGGDEAMNIDGGEMATYSEEDLKSAIEEAVKPLQARITELETSHEAAELDSKIAEVKTPLETQIAELQSELDAAKVEAASARDELNNTVEYLTGLASEAAEKAAFETLREERVAQIREVASFDDEYVSANADRWTRMDDEAFAAALEDWKLISAKSESASASKTKEEIPGETVMQTAAETASAKVTGMDALREIMDLSLRGADPRTV